MKLYEFTLNDNLNLPETELLAQIKKDLESEATLQGWAAGYKIQQCQKPKHLANGEIEYFFVVDGAYSTGAQGEENSDPQLSNPSRDGAAASPL